MNATTLAALLVGNSVRLRTATVALALALVCLAGATACGGIGAGNQTSNHSCADKVAQAAVSGSVPGLWNCLASSFQSTLQSGGATPGDNALVNQPFALTWSYIGQTAHEVDYEFVLTPAAASMTGSHYATLAVWVDSHGLVTGLDLGTSPS